MVSAWLGWGSQAGVPLLVSCLSSCLFMHSLSEAAFGHQSTRFQVARAIVFLHADFNTDSLIAYLYLPLHRNKQDKFRDVTAELEFRIIFKFLCVFIHASVFLGVFLKGD